MPRYVVLEKVRTLLEWADELLSKMLDGVCEWSGYPLGVVHILRNHFWGSRETPPPQWAKIGG